MIRIYTGSVRFSINFRVSNSMLGSAKDFITGILCLSFKVFFPSSASPKIFSLPTVFVCLLSAQSAVRFCPAAAAAAAAVFLSLWPSVHKRRSEAEERV